VAKKRRGWFRRILVLAAGLVFAFYAFCIATLVALRWTTPPTTGVQAQRRIEAWLHDRPYHKRYVFVPLNRISPELQHAVISAEDGRLGRGGSSITQQLVKNLFLTTNRSLVKKAVEFTLAPLAERILNKRRILELYLNVIEWGAGIYGAEEASRAWYGVPAAKIDREQAARMAALLPSPLRRKPGRMNTYSAEILRRMAQSGW
jgi:monofunctional glycosyltransferase